MNKNDTGERVLSWKAEARASALLAHRAYNLRDRKSGPYPW
jgi:hypothetical protein